MMGGLELYQPSCLKVAHRTLKHLVLSRQAGMLPRLPGMTDAQEIDATEHVSGSAPCSTAISACTVPSSVKPATRGLGTSAVGHAARDMAMLGSSQFSHISLSRLKLQPCHCLTADQHATGRSLQYDCA